MSRWFRHYAGMMRDEKLVSAAIRSKQPVERVLWIWGAILESAAEINDNGKYSLDAAEAAYFLRTDEADICAILDALTAAARIAEGAVVHWGDRQFQSDKSATRQAAYRERKRGSDADNRQGDGGVTAASRHGDAPYTDTKTDTKTEPERIANFRKVGEGKPSGPRHGATSPSRGTTFIRYDTNDWAAYAADFRATNGYEPQPNEHGGYWFKTAGAAPLPVPKRLSG